MGGDGCKDTEWSQRPRGSSSVCLQQPSCFDPSCPFRPSPSSYRYKSTTHTHTHAHIQLETYTHTHATEKSTNTLLAGSLYYACCTLNTARLQSVFVCLLSFYYLRKHTSRLLVPAALVCHPEKAPDDEGRGTGTLESNIYLVIIRGSVVRRRRRRVSRPRPVLCLPLSVCIV